MFQSNKIIVLILVMWTFCGISGSVFAEKSTDSEIPRYSIPRSIRFLVGLVRPKRGFGHGAAGGGGHSLSYGGGGAGGHSIGYGVPLPHGGGHSIGYGVPPPHGGGYGGGGAAPLAQQAANQAKAALAAQGPAAYQASQNARGILADQATYAAKQAQAVVAAKQHEVSQITHAANAAQAAAYAESTQLAKANRAVSAAEIANHQALQAAHYGGYHAQDQIYAAQHALQEARNVQAWQAQQAYQAQQNAWALAQKQQAALHDLSEGQHAANKAAWAASAAQSTASGGYGHGVGQSNHYG